MLTQRCSSRVPVQAVQEREHTPCHGPDTLDHQSMREDLSTLARVDIERAVSTREIISFPYPGRGEDGEGTDEGYRACYILALGT